jgi:hypothetical protein
MPLSYFITLRSPGCGLLGWRDARVLAVNIRFLLYSRGTMPIGFQQEATKPSVKPVHEDVHAEKQGFARSCLISSRAYLFLALCVAISFTATAAAQQDSVRTDKTEESIPNSPSKDSESTNLGRLPIEWLIGPYIPVRETLHPLTNAEREQIYFRQTFLTAGSYLARAFSAGIDQARGEPSGWGGGMSGYGRRYVARYGQFVVQNTIVAGGNAWLGYEPRYDFCRCNGFWPRTLHAVSRNFVAYNSTERELRPQLPTYVGAFGAGMLYNSWLPGEHGVWKGGASSVLSQAGIGSGYNFVSEFALDILHKFGIKKDVKRGE